MIIPTSAGPYLLGLNSNGSLGMGVMCVVVEGLTSGVSARLQVSVGGSIWNDVAPSSTFTADGNDAFYSSSELMFRILVVGTPVAGMKMSCSRAISAGILR